MIGHHTGRKSVKTLARRNTLPVTFDQNFPACRSLSSSKCRPAVVARTHGAELRPTCSCNHSTTDRTPANHCIDACRIPWPGNRPDPAPTSTCRTSRWLTRDGPDRQHVPGVGRMADSLHLRISGARDARPADDQETMPAARARCPVTAHQGWVGCGAGVFALVAQCLDRALCGLAPLPESIFPMIEGACWSPGRVAWAATAVLRSSRRDRIDGNAGRLRHARPATRTAGRADKPSRQDHGRRFEQRRDTPARRPGSRSMPAGVEVQVGSALVRVEGGVGEGVRVDPVGELGGVGAFGQSFLHEADGHARWVALPGQHPDEPPEHRLGGRV
jgi:hypothetical protein